MTEKTVEIIAKDIDDNGVWHWEGSETPIPLLGNHVPIPDRVRLPLDPEMQEVLALVTASDWLEMCPACEQAPAPGILLVTEYTKIYPAHCCNKMMWMTDERGNSDILPR